MKYISIGAVLNEGTEHILDVTHGGAQFRLTGEKARLWLNSRVGFAEAFNPMQLYKIGKGHVIQLAISLCEKLLLPFFCFSHGVKSALMLLDNLAREVSVTDL